ncbi:MAG: site-specific integrase [Solidesulfovibrio sp.]|uniref:tyrosine-type recombinase/integrase n=1 Tax=Solidesulfovibrio sp. TaxID=2910990 RepID=UPI0031595DAA
MSVHKRPNNDTYYVAYRDAERRQRTKNFGKGREAKRQAQKFDEEIKARKKVEAPLPEPLFTQGSRVYLDQLAQMYLNTRKVEGTTLRTLKTIKSILEKHLIPAFAQRPIDEIRYDEIMTVVGKAFTTQSPVTRGRYLSYLKTVFAFGIKHDLILKNPLRNWRKGKETPRDSKLTVADLMKIKAVAPPYLAWALEVAWNLGVRTGPSELFALKWSDIDWQDSTIRVFATKTRTLRTIPLSPAFLTRLQEMREKAQTEYLIEFKGRQVKELRKALKSACEAAEIKYPVVFYDVRHLFATTLLREGGDLAAVSKLMGHSSVHMTANQYYHLLGDEKRRTIAKLPSLSPEQQATPPPVQPQPQRGETSKILPFRPIGQKAVLAASAASKKGQAG